MTSIGSLLNDEHDRHDGPEHDGPEHAGPGHDGPEQDGPEQDGPEHDGPKHDGPEQDGREAARSDGTWTDEAGTPADPRATPSRHRAEPQPVARGRWLRSAAALALPLLLLPVLAVPTHGPGELLDAARLVTGDIRSGTVGALVLLLLWVLWLQLVVSVVVEALSVRRGSGLPPRVPLVTDRQQRFARRHVSRLLEAVSPDRRFQPDRYRPRVFRRVAGAGAPYASDPLADAAASAQQLHQVRRHRPPPLRWDVVDAGLMCAGLLDALYALRQRRLLTRAAGLVPVTADADALGVEVAARVGADTEGADLLDRALRWSSAVLTGAGRPPLRLLAARLTAGSLELLPAEPRADLPVPFQLSDGGARWTLPRGAAVPDVPGLPTPAPALVSLGGDGVGRVLVDLEAAGGVVCIDGDRDAVRSVVAAAAVELMTARWCAPTQVTLVGFGDQLVPLGGRRVRCAGSLGEVVDELTDRLSAARQAGRSGPATEVVVLAAPPEAADLADLAAWFLPAPARSPLAVLVAGPVPDAAWRFELDREGVLDTGPLRHRVGAQAISARTYAALARLVQADTEDEPADPEALLPRGRVELADVRVLLHLFGAPDASGDVAPGTAQVIEVATYVALHDTVSLPELGAALWPRGVSEATRNEAVRRTQWWLGLDAGGRPRLTLEDGMLRLSPEVQVDWALLVDLSVRGNPGAALALLRGEPVTSSPAGGYTWLAREPIARRIGAVVADGCARAAQASLLAGDVAAATALAVAGLRVSPYAAVLWDVLTATAGDEASRVSIQQAYAARAASLPF